MLIIAVSHGGFSSDPYTCSKSFGNSRSVNVKSVNPKDVDSVLACIVQEQNLPKDSVDELLVIDGDKVLAHHTLK